MKKITSIVLSVVMLLTILSMGTTAFAGSKNPYDVGTEPTRAVYYTSPIMTGKDVIWIQQALNIIMNSGLTLDSKFGPACKKATLSFQKKYGLKQDGSFGPKTRSKMISLLKSKGYTKKSKYLTIYNGIYTVPSTCYVNRIGGTMSLNIKSSSKWSVTTTGNWISTKVSGNNLKITFNRTFSSNGRTASFTIKNSDGLSQKITLCQFPIPKGPSKHTHSTKYIMLFSINETADMVFTSVKVCTTCGYVYSETANSWSPPFDDSMI